MLKRQSSIGLPTGHWQALSNQPISAPRTRLFGFDCTPKLALFGKTKPMKKHEIFHHKSLSRNDMKKRQLPKTLALFYRNTLFARPMVSVVGTRC
jgi:hypothetical protein